MYKIKILIVEDELIIAEDLRDTLEKMGYQVIGTAMDISEAQALLKQSPPDLALIDISLADDDSGIDLANFINRTRPVPFIYITSHADKSTVEKAKKTSPHGYLVKPFERDDLYTTIEVALYNFHNKMTAHSEEENVLIKEALFVKDGHRYVKIVLPEILWLQSDGNYVEIHTTNKKYLIRDSLKELVQKLPSQRFLRTHKSYVVNIQHIQAVESTALYINAEVIPIGRAFQEQVLRLLNISK